MNQKEWIKSQELAYHLEGSNEASQSLASDKVKLMLNYVGSGKRVLDLGCNNGGVSNALNRQGNMVVGVDLKKVAAIAKVKYPYLNIISADLSRHFPFKDCIFDVIYASEIIEHIPDSKLFLQECFRVLVRGGYLILTTPNKFYIRNRVYYAFGIELELHPLHIHDYSFTHIRKLLEFAGFNIKKECGLSSKCDKVWHNLAKLLPKTFKQTIMIFASKGEIFNDE